MFNTLFSYFTRTEMIADAIFLGCMIFAWYLPLFANGVFGSIERFGIELADRKTLVIGGIAALTILLRLALLHWLSVPVPQIHDEFGYLLAADTFAHGRLANPPHALFVFFDTIHVNQHPAYMSKYPPAQGAALALGQLLGHPWIGVLLSGAAMCGTTLWMLQGWLPAQWALLGGLVVMFRLALFSYWVNSYWGGAIPMIGGALVLGALPRILKHLRMSNSVILGLGAALLANSRPWEGFLLCLPVAIVLLRWMYTRFANNSAVLRTKFVAPICVIGLLTGAFIGYYNWRNTGSLITFPEVLNEHTYSSTPVFVWQNARAPLHYLNSQFENFYNGWDRGYWSYYRVSSVETAFRHLLLVTPMFLFFFLWPELCIPLLALPWVLRDRRMRFLFWTVAICFGGSYVVVWFLPHYAAPVMPGVFALVTEGVRQLRRWQYKGHPVGIGLSRTMLLFAVLLAPFHPHESSMNPPPAEIAYRAQIATNLEQLPGKHLVIVRYPLTRDTGEWVYNLADIDRAKVIWAREIPDRSNRPLLDYFKDRTVWLVEPGVFPIALKPYVSRAP